MKAQIGLIGLAVMGENLVLNMANKGYSVAVFNRTLSAVDSFLDGRAKGKSILGTYSLEQLVQSVEKPRKIMMMVKAGKPVDETIDKLLVYMEPGDIIIDGGNSYFEDTERRARYVENKGLYYIGTGVSGGEEGALHGPSIMPGGSCQAWPAVQRIFQDIAAKTEDGTPCCDWIGPGGSGHFVKMVHNGIEYGDMQLISETFWIMQCGLGMSYQEIHKVFDQWNKGRLDSYLIQITSDILGYADTDGTPLLNKILDSAGQKGTGRWTGIAALNANTPLTLIVESVFARSLSSQKEQLRYFRPMACKLNFPKKTGMSKSTLLNRLYTVPRSCPTPRVSN
jgi:6-phosphogluconate dehydrogenase